VFIHFAKYSIINIITQSSIKQSNGKNEKKKSIYKSQETFKYPIWLLTMYFLDNNFINVQKKNKIWCLKVEVYTNACLTLWGNFQSKYGVIGRLLFSLVHKIEKFNQYSIKKSFLQLIAIVVKIMFSK
jgi:hypothetical protein